MCVSHCQMPVVVGVLVIAFYDKAVVDKLQTFFERPFADHLDGEAVQFAHTLVLSAGRGIPGYLLQAFADGFFIRLFQSVHPYRIQAVAVHVGLYRCRKLFPVFRHTPGFLCRVGQCGGFGFKFPFGFASALVERFAFTLQRGYLFLQLRLL